ncbi:hypothetical protein ABRZ87_07450 [Vibrio vulnificus]|uniref:hypothetical protein n=1 Tax=Vibrio vulnificus TaxID=672 RepID=UPI0006AD0BA2|nr:hypothetical protein [Vibrio vulnificus]ELK8439797.1 hypothetical protein [Vibrio vulnificus]ELK8508827.1 hypothetical protein [Vibrio vulnificus]ELK8995305.1 hypothetical protein [Vibrio vulnificus]KOR96142.1 hypothetical protein LO82_20195 [Vibrio vulnificus]HAS6089103.1 hypothetical protein [Vibrio vulnificus]
MEVKFNSQVFVLLFIPLISIFDVNLAVSQVTFVFALFFLIISILITRRSVKVNKYHYVLFISIAFIIIFSSLHRVLIFHDIDNQLLIRIVKFVIFFLYFTVAVRLVGSTSVDKCLLYIKVFLWILSIHLLILGWQQLSFKFGFYFPDIGKTTVHGVESNIRDALTHRLTGIANEPSYMARALLQISVLSLFFYTSSRKKKSKYLCLTLASIFFGFLTFSLSFIFAFFIVFSAFIFRCLSVRNFSFLMLFCLFVFSIFYLNQDFYILQFIFDRFNTESSGTSARSHDLILAIKMFFDNCSIISCSIGFGPSSIKYFNDWFNGYLIYETTNNVFVDVLVEFGFFVLLFTVFLFFKYFGLVVKYQYSFLYFLVFVLSNLFRSDYLTFNYYVYVVVGFMLLKVERYYHQNDFQ